MHRWLFCLLGLVLMSCGPAKQVLTPDASSVYNKWKLELLYGDSIAITEPLFIELSEGNRIGGFVGCNSLAGEYTLAEDQSIRFTNLITTHRHCRHAKLEGKVLNMLSEVTHYAIEGKKMRLKIDGGIVVAECFLLKEPEFRGILND